ncbi:MAG: ImpA family metalloprotease [Cellvibrionales bacterium]|nr:ImpA family metalloprotease [Cellvibrionales bacterium]
MKSFVFLVLVLIVTGVFLSGCGNGDVIEVDDQVNPLPTQDAINKAVETGDPAYLPEDSSLFELRIQTLIKEEIDTSRRLLYTIFGDEQIEFDPGRSSRFFYPKELALVNEVVVGNKGHAFVTAFNKNGYRAVAIGDDVLDELPDGEHVSFQAPLTRLIAWLAPADVSPSISLMLMSKAEMTDAESWLIAQFSDAKISRCTDENTLLACVHEADLVVTGSDPDMSQQQVIAALDRAVTNKSALLYLHNRGWNASELTNPILHYFGVSTQAPGGAGNYFSQDAARWESVDSMFAQTNRLKAVYDLVKRFEANSFSFDLSDCAEGDNACENVPAYKTEFLEPAQALQKLVNAWDRDALDIFNSDGFFLEKHLVLLADKYRESVTFPLSRDTSETHIFLKSFFADHLAYYSRQFNPTQPDLGNFSRSDFSHITPIDKTISLTSRERFRAAGVYALPGQTVEVTRTDNLTDVNASVFINTQRESSVHHMDNGDYNRPKFMQSPHIQIKSGETIYFTSPYGGPIQVGFYDVGSELTFIFSHIGEHPFWRVGDNDTSFLNKLSANEYDWAEIATEHFEVHSQTPKLLNTLEGSLWNTPSKLERFITKYHHNYHKVLSGHRGENIDAVNEIYHFAEGNGLTLAEFNHVQHMNADQAACGYGCSGNPYDAFWSFDILGHGDLHEVGHNVESGRFRFNGMEGHAVTNFYSYYVKSRADKEEGISHNCQSLPFDTLLQDIEASQLEPDPKAAMASLNYTGWSQGAALVIQMMMHAESETKLANGWHLIPRLHILERAFNLADNNQDSWNAAKVALGFSLFTRDEVLAIDRNDWLLIASSMVTQIDYRPYFDLIGQGYSDKANDQVASFGFDTVKKGFYLPETNNAYCDRLSGWPLSQF